MAVPIVPLASTFLDDIFDSLFFGGAWYFGLLIWLVLTVSLLLMWKYTGVFLVILDLAMELQYYNYLVAYPGTDRYAWGMVIMLAFMVFTALYVAMARKK